MDSQLVDLLRPFLPALAQGQQPPNADPQAWRNAQALWLQLSPVLDAGGALQEAIAELIANPSDEDYQAALRVQFKKLLKQNPNLKQSLEQLLQSFGDQTLNCVTIHQKVSGSGNQVIGQVMGGTVLGNISGGNIVIGSGPQNSSPQNPGAAPPNSGAPPFPASPNAVKTILILTANPKGTDSLRLAEEVREIQTALERSSQREAFKIVSRTAVRTTDIRRALLDHSPYLIHFSGHGVGQAGGGLSTVGTPREISRVPEEESPNSEPEGIVLEDVVGQPQLVSGSSLASLFAIFKDSVQAVVLNSCYSQVQAEEIVRHIPLVVGMKRAIGDRAAIEFARGFYDGLFAGQSVERSFLLGQNSIQLENIPEYLTPILKQV